jgi:hypothetical protein
MRHSLSRAAGVQSGSTSGYPLDDGDPRASTSAPQRLVARSVAWAKAAGEMPDMSMASTNVWAAYLPDRVASHVSRSAKLEKLSSAAASSFI